jgi:hypothetical protein
VIHVGVSNGRKLSRLSQPRNFVPQRPLSCCLG